MGLIAAAVVAVVGAAAYAGSAAAENKAKQSALTAQQKAWLNLKPIDIKDTQKVASDADIERFKNSLATQEQYDPTFSAMRKQGSANILKGLREDASGHSIAQNSLDQLAESNTKNSAAEQGVIDQLIARAKSDLDAGATLPPEFQAELVRSGLAKAGTSGLPLNGEGAAGVESRTLLGKAGIELQQQRQNEALQAAEGAGGIQSRRAQILEGLSTLDNNLRTASAARSGGAIQLANGSMPNVGLSGADVANLSLKNNDFENRRTLALGGIKANKYLSQGAANSAYISAGGQAITGVIGAGAGGGSPSWIGGLLNSSNGNQFNNSAGNPVY